MVTKDEMILVKEDAVILSSFKRDGENVAGYISQALAARLEKTDTYQDFNFPIDDVSYLLDKPDRISVSSKTASSGFGEIQFKLKERSLPLPYSNSLYRKTIPFYRSVVGTFEEIMFQRLSDTLDNLQHELNDASIKTNVSIEQVDSQVDSLKELKGRGTNLRPDNDKRNDKAQNKLNELKGKLNTIVSEISNYRADLQDVKDIADVLKRWSNSLNESPFVSISSDITVNLKDFNSGSSTISDIGAVSGLLGVFGLSLAGGMAYFGAAGGVAVALAPVIAVVGAILAVVGGVLLIINEIDKANKIKEHYEKVEKDAGEGVTKANGVISQLQQARTAVKDIFDKIEPIVKELRDPGSSDVISRSDIYNTLKGFADKSTEFSTGAKAMQTYINRGLSAPDAAQKASILINLDISDDPTMGDDDTKHDELVLLLGYYISNDDIDAITDYFKLHKENIKELREVLIVTLLLNSNSPSQVQSKLNAIDDSLNVTLADIEDIKEKNSNLLFFANAA
ncbi:hypothetical protein [Pseudoalteromonas sp. OOF1S-7]|uniref:hypothetical protein n=1 Tax=Pseudoalteromonas sp. OOF1S-7 TaxID=2917757 RepID=UPI001EF63B0A|nr:hypothetical protein [Pseudoalteromonas sp. OOF1S-7]MCG7534973.1 hypothetical protein [Pseudoalteromonas sp. OOF1S-7]